MDYLLISPVLIHIIFFFVNSIRNFFCDTYLGQHLIYGSGRTSRSNDPWIGTS